MKKIMALATAAAIGAGVLGMAGEASAKPWYPHPYMPMHAHPYGWGYHPGFYFGFGVGPAFPPPFPHYYVSKHVRWCAENYRTYNPATDTYHPRLGVTAVCVSPWWTY